MSPGAASARKSVIPVDSSRLAEMAPEFPLPLPASCRTCRAVRAHRASKSKYTTSLERSVRPLDRLVAATQIPQLPTRSRSAENHVEEDGTATQSTSIGSQSDNNPIAILIASIRASGQSLEFDETCTESTNRRLAQSYILSRCFTRILSVTAKRQLIGICGKPIIFKKFAQGNSSREAIRYRKYVVAL